MLEIETRGFKGPRSYDTSGLPLHLDNQTIVKERIYVDKADHEIAHDEVTVIDHALTRPWTVMKNYRRRGGSAALLARDQLLREQRPCRDRQGALHAQRRPLPDADQEGSAAARSALFQADAEVGGTAMLARTLLCVIACAAFSAAAGAQILDYSKYPDLGGQWRPIGGPGRFDISKPAGRGQQAPLTAEYQAKFEANLKDQAAGGQGTTSTYKCLSPGMPRVTNAYGETEFIITPDTTYILMDHILDDRRIFTDGREWPAELEPSLLGYSIGKWIDSKGDGHFDVLEVETRGFRGPRAVRRQRTAAARGQPDRRQGADLHRQGRSPGRP